MGDTACKGALRGCQFVHLVKHTSDADLLEEATRLRQALLLLEATRAERVLARPTMSIAPFRLSEVTAEDVLRTANATCLDACQAEKTLQISVKVSATNLEVI